MNINVAPLTVEEILYPLTRLELRPNAESNVQVEDPARRFEVGGGAVLFLESVPL
jgi:hypothetical protein